MSEAVRTALAEAANTVDGISVQPWFRSSTKAGDGMVRLDRITYPNPFGGIRTWQVLIVLPQDLAQAERYLEDKTPALVEALGNEMAVDSATPQQIALDTGALPCLVIEGHRAED